MKALFRLRVSRTAVINSTSAVARLTKYVSELVNFAPTKCAAELVLKMLETIKAVDENDDARLVLIKRVVDVLLLIREHFDQSSAMMPPNLGEKMQEFEFILLSIYERLKPVARRSFFSRAINKDRIKSDLSAHSAMLDVAIGKLNLCLLLGVAVATQMSLSQNNRQSDGPSQATDLVRTLVHDSDEEFLDRIRALYDEFRISDIQLLPRDGKAEGSVVKYSDLSYAMVKGEKRLIKGFDGEDEEERKRWLKELRHWHRLKHPNVLQLQGVTNRASPHLYVVFQNTQARCLATYIVNALNNQSVPTIAATIVRMMNEAVSAIKYARKQLRVDEATSVLAAEDASFALGAGDNLLLSVNPLKPKSKGKRQVSLRHTLQEMFWPPMESRNVSRYLTRLKSAHNTAEVLDAKTNQTRTAVNAFLADYCALDDKNDEHLLLPKSGSYRTNQPIFSASIDCGREVKAGDYGVLVSGREEDFAFCPYGNACDDSPGVMASVTETKLSDYTSDGLADIVQDSPRVWRSDLNTTKGNGYSSLKANWYHMQILTDIDRTARYFVNSIPLLLCDKSLEEVVLVTKVTHVKEYRVAINDPESDTPQATSLALAKDDANRPLPFVYMTEPVSQEDELQFSQFPPSPNLHDSSDETWDPRVICLGKERELKRIRYVQLKREDIIKRFGLVPVVRDSQRVKCSAGPIILKNPQTLTPCRECEQILEGSKAWCMRKSFWKEYP